jgi:hypothetical protein
LRRSDNTTRNRRKAMSFRDHMLIFEDYNELSISDRMRATAAARDDARSGEHTLSDSPWTALDEDDPRRIAFENELRKCYAARD